MPQVKTEQPEGLTYVSPGHRPWVLKKEETSLQAAIREVKEATGYDISKQPIENLGTVYIEYDERDHFIYQMFHTQLQDDPGSVKINFDEHKGLHG